MKVLGLMGIGLLMIAFSLPAGATCSSSLYGNEELNQTSLSIPVTIIKTIIKKVVGLDIEVTLEFKAQMEFTLDCACEPCCPAPQKQVASLTVSSSIQAFGGAILFSSAKTESREGEPNPREGISCSLPVTIAYKRGARVPAIGVGLSISGIGIETKEVSMRFKAQYSCECTGNEGCIGNTHPTIVDVSPEILELVPGSSATVTVTAFDREGNLSRFSYAKGTGEGGIPYLPAELSWVEPIEIKEGQAMKATYKVSFPSEALASSEGQPLLNALVYVLVWDECGLHDSKYIPVMLFYPPVLKVLRSGWEDKAYVVELEVDDPDFSGKDRWEVVEVMTGEVVGGEVWLPPLPLVTRDFPKYLVVAFYPKADNCSRKFEIIARDKLSQKEARVTVEVPNRPPSFARLESLKIRPGEKVSLTVSASDPDGDTVTLEKILGPGDFSPGRRGSGTWSWTPSYSSPWRFVGFKATDPCGGIAYLFVPLLWPPLVSNPHVWVPRGGTAAFTVYVSDPDSSNHTFQFHSLPSGIEIEKPEKAESPSYYGTYFGNIYRFEIKANVCDGDYSIPFTVTDPDGLSAEGVLTVHVFGNRPPQVRGELQGEATVTLYPDRVQVSPVVLRGEVFDPDGDPVFVEAPGIPPQFASNLSTFLGSLISVYFPYPESEEACRAVREKDVIEDFYTIILRDSCGATTEVPVKVRISVVDKAPPRIVYPARDRTVECDGSGNTAELSEWLRSQGGAWAFDNCCDVVWSDDYGPGKFVNSCGKTGYVTVTFTARDCAGNSSTTSATFRIVDTTPPALQAPPDITLECDEPTDPSRAGWPVVLDICDPSPKVTYTDEVLPGACPQAKVIRRTWKATDACGNFSQAVQTITVLDTKAPEFVSFPSDLDLGCNPADTSPNATGKPVIQDNCDPNPQLGYTDQVSQVGCRVNISRIWTARDACGNVSQRVQQIVYTVDTVPPSLALPPNVDLGCQCTPPDTSPAVTGLAQAADNCDPQPSISWSDSEDIQGEFHTITRTWVAVDSCGNRAQGDQIIRFRIDQTPPVLSVPGDVDLGCHCTPPDTSPAATGWARATDNCDPNPAISYEDTETVDGEIHTIIRTWRATDRCGNYTEGTQRITYRLDQTPPTLNCPSGFTAYLYGCTARGPVWVPFHVSATDNCDPAPQAWCTPSGDWFNEGTTYVTVVCAARDRCGNETQRTCTFPVTVIRVNHPPVARGDYVDCDGFCSIPVLQNDYDPDNDPIYVVSVSTPRCGTAWLEGNTIYYTTMGWSCPTPPGPGVTDSFTYTISDGCSQSGAFVTIYLTCQICPLALPPQEYKP
jgi:hypothetical protein